MGTDEVFKGQSAVSDTILPYTRCFQAKYSRWEKNQCIIWLIQFYPKKNKIPHNQQHFLYWTLEEADPAVETIVWPITEECAWVCVAKHMQECPKIHSHSRSFTPSSNVCIPAQIKSFTWVQHRFMPMLLRFLEHTTKAELYTNLTKLTTNSIFLYIYHKSGILSVIQNRV